MTGALTGDSRSPSVTGLGGKGAGFPSFVVLVSESASFSSKTRLYISFSFSNRGPHSLLCSKVSLLLFEPPAGGEKVAHYS